MNSKPGSQNTRTLNRKGPSPPKVEKEPTLPERIQLIQPAREKRGTTDRKPAETLNSKWSSSSKLKAILPSMAKLKSKLANGGEDGAVSPSENPWWGDCPVCEGPFENFPTFLTIMNVKEIKCYHCKETFSTDHEYNGASANPQ